MRYTKPITYLAACWALSIPIVLAYALLAPHPQPTSVTYAHHVLWIIETDDQQLQVISTTPVEIQERLPELADDVLYTATMHFNPHESTKLFRRWNSVVTPQMLRIQRTNEQPFDREALVTMIINEAKAANQQPNPPEEYTFMRDLGLIEALEINRRVVSQRYPINIALDLLTAAWLIGGLALCLIFAGRLIKV